MTDVHSRMKANQSKIDSLLEEMTSDLQSQLMDSEKQMVRCNFVHPHTNLSVYPSVRMSVYPYVCLSICPYVCLSVCLSVSLLYVWWYAMFCAFIFSL